jgi:hypothetical protein
VPGATHDKTLCDGLHTLDRLPDGIEADAAKGYQGLAAQVATVAVCDVATREEQCPPRLTAQTPHKKPKGGALTDEQRAFNRRLGAVRIRVEHSSAGSSTGPSSPRASAVPTTATPRSCVSSAALSTPRPPAGKQHNALILHRL